MGTHSDMKLLLVDDEPRNLDVLEAILEDEAYEMLRAADGDDALRLLLAHGDEVAAIMIDVQMPGVNGFELAKIIKGTKRFRQIPILFLTAHFVEDRDIITGYGSGGVDYLTKPLNPEILRHKVAVFAELFRKTRALAELNETLEARVRERTAELERSEAALREAAQQKDQFLAVLAHELRNPLTPLRTGLDILGQVLVDKPGAVGKTLGVMNRQLDHIVRLIDDLLDVSRISRGVLALKRERVELGALLRSAVETFRPQFEQKRITLTLAPPPRVDAVIDPTRVTQIVGNLLHNASKYTPAGGTVALRLGFQGGTASITVSDDGMGIPADQLERVFEMFARIERRTPAADNGAGIGLALARSLAQMHGGGLTVASGGEGQGTTFTLTLPALGLEETRPEVEPAPAVVPAGPALDILVIEDNDDVADMLAAWLEALGHRVQVARTGPRGVELALAGQPQVVLCDIGLPEMDGVEVCRRVRERSGTWRPLMVAITGWGKEEDRRRTTAAGFDHHLVKPVAIETLTSLLASVAQQSARGAAS